MLGYSTIGSEPIASAEAQQSEDISIFVSVVDAPDSATSFATVSLAATAAITDGADSCTSSVSINVQANAALFDGGDSISSTASAIETINVNINVTDAPDTVVSTVAVGGARVYTLNRARTVFVHKEKHSGRSR